MSISSVTKYPCAITHARRIGVTDSNLITKELGVDPSAPVPSSNRLPFDAASCEAIENLKPEVVSFHFGLPGDNPLARVKATGCFIIGSATTAAEATWLEPQGVDAVIARGFCRHANSRRNWPPRHRTNRDGLVRANDRALAHADVVGSRTLDLALALACGVRTHPIRTPFDRLIRAASMVAFDRALGPLGNLFGNTPSIRL
jgi:Nitronate monooxygenase